MFIEFIIFVSILIFSLVVHENAHARAAYYLGDSTAKNMGRFSFNPLKHITVAGALLPIGLYLINAPIISAAKPVLYNPVFFKNPKRDMIIIGLAGPLSNFILAVIAFLLYNRLSVLPDALSLYFNKVLENIFLTNLLLCFFNLIPIPPLDGSIIFMSTLIDKRHKLVTELTYGGIGVLFSLLLMAPLIGEHYGKNYNLVGSYLDGCISNVLYILKPLAAGI